MNTIMTNWGVSQYNRVMMDGSGSSQMKVGNLSVYGSKRPWYAPDYRTLPNVVEVYKK